MCDPVIKQMVQVMTCWMESLFSAHICGTINDVRSHFVASRALSRFKSSSLNTWSVLWWCEFINVDSEGMWSNLKYTQKWTVTGFFDWNLLHCWLSLWWTCSFWTPRDCKVRHAVNWARKSGPSWIRLLKLCLKMRPWSEGKTSESTVVCATGCEVWKKKWYTFPKISVKVWMFLSVSVLDFVLQQAFWFYPWVKS